MKKHEHIVLWASILVLFAAALLVLYPLFRRGFFVSDDGGWMIIRLSAFYQSFREGQFPVRFLGRLNFGYGYPVANFLYPGFLYIGSLIHLMGFSFINSVKIILGVSVLTGAFYTFRWLRSYFRTGASLVGALSYLFAPYLLFDLYTRGSVGELLAFAWAPMGLFSISSKKPWLLALSISLLIVSHNSLALLFLGFYACYITVLGRWREYWLMYMLGIGMVMFFWFPAIYERKYVIFDAIQVSNPMAYFITTANAMRLGFAGIIASILALGIKKTSPKDKTFFLISFFVTLFLVLPVSSFVWNSSLLTHIIQFPYRFLSLTIFIGCWLISYVLDHQKPFVRIALTSLCIGLGIWQTILAIRQVQYTDFPEGYYTTNEATTTVQDEYMPRWVIAKPTQHANERIFYYQGAGTFEYKKVSTQSIDVVVHAAEESTVQINTIYYPGWGVTLDDVPLRINYLNAQGVIRITVPQGTHHLVAAFRETISRFLADNISLGFFVWYVIAMVIERHTSFRKRRS